MIPVFLTKTKTRDGLWLDGIYIKPERKSKTALIWLHGLSSRFYSSQTLVKELSSLCQKNNIGYFKFNTRGHDIVTYEKTKKTKFKGAAFEKFEDCVFDIRAVISLAKKLGYKNIILAGHSTGANKALYYLYKTKDHSVKGLILAGALSDISAETKRLGPKRFKKAVLAAKKLSKRGKNVLMPQEYGIYSAGRFVSLCVAGKAEDVFPYHNPKANWKELKSVRAPIAVILGSRDEHLDRPTKKLIEIFRANAKSTKSFSGIVIKGANHGFRKKEKEFSQTVVKFIRRAIG